MSARRGREGSDPGGPAPDGAAGADPPGDDEIEILEVVGVNETEPPASTGPSEGSGVASAEPPGPSLADLEEAVREKERYHDLWRRLQAEFDNFRKRAERDVERQRTNAAADLVSRLLPVLDNLERALQISAGDDPMRRGVELIHQQMLDFLGKEGLEIVPAIGERFDPHRHEAVEILDGAEGEEGVVVEEMRKGFTYKDRLVRPALVKVSSGRGGKPKRRASAAD